MENKYYDLIISLIKEHRKYPGYEAILEDIAKDVYEHSKVVLSSVSNNEVIIAYLNKVITTSLVTVPKKMNFNTRARHRVITTILQQTTITQPEPIEASVDVTSSDKDVQIELTSVPEISEEVFDENIIEEENLELLVEDTDLSIEESLVENLEEKELVITDDKIENEEEAPSEEELVEPAIISEETTKNFVDMMINGISNQKATEEISEIEDLQEESCELYETLEELEPEEEPVDLDEFSNNESESIETIEEVQETNDFVEEPIELEESSEDESAIELDIENNAPIFDIGEIAENQEEDYVEELPTLDTEFVELSEDCENTDLEDYLEPESISEEVIQEKTEEFIPPTYDRFNYEPKKYEYDSEEIFSYLEDIDKKHPERKILTICNLKYSQKLSIAQIAQKIGFAEEEVIEVLNEIIETVKD